MSSFTDLDVWKIGLQLVQEVYRLTQLFPKAEQFGLTVQLRSASTSILANLAEGFGRFTYPDKIARFTISRGECAEVKAFLLIAVSLRFIDSHESQRALELVDRVGKLLSGLINSSRKLKHR